MFIYWLIIQGWSKRINGWINQNLGWWNTMSQNMERKFLPNVARQRSGQQYIAQQQKIKKYLKQSGLPSEWVR